MSRTDPPRQVKSPNRPWHLHRKTLKPQTPNNSVPHLNVPINCRRTSDTTWDRTLTTALVAGSTIRDIGAKVLQQEAVMAHGRHEGPQSQLRSWQQLEQLPQTHCQVSRAQLSRESPGPNNLLWDCLNFGKQMQDLYI